MNKSKCYSYFSICSEGEIGDKIGFVAAENSFFDPKEITEFLGIEPHKTTLMGEERKYVTGTYQFSSWDCCRQEEPAIDAEEQCLQIVRQLTPLIPKLNEIKKRYNVAFSILIVPSIYNEESPVLAFNHEIIEFCYLTGTEIGIDMYIYDKE